MKEDKALYSGHSDEELMALVCKRNIPAFNAIYQRYSKRILYYFFRMLGGSKEKAEDFLQDLFMKIVEKPHLFDPKKTFSTWLFSIAHNMCKNEYRKMEVRKISQNEMPADVIDGNHQEMEKNIDLTWFSERLYKELEKLESDHKTAFLLRYREGFSIREVSEVLECAEGTVKSRLFYTNQKLSVKLEAFNPKNKSYET